MGPLSIDDGDSYYGYSVNGYMQGTGVFNGALQTYSSFLPNPLSPTTGIWKGIGNFVIDAANLGIMGGDAMRGGNPMFSNTFPRIGYSDWTETVTGAHTEVGLGLLSPAKGAAGSGNAFRATTATSPFAIIGKLEDTRNFAGLKDSKILLRFDYNEGMQADFTNSIIQQKLPAYLASPKTRENLFRSSGNLTEFGKEVRALEQAGYTRWGNWFAPPK